MGESLLLIAKKYSVDKIKRKLQKKKLHRVINVYLCITGFKKYVISLFLFTDLKTAGGTDAVHEKLCGDEHSCFCDVNSQIKSTSSSFHEHGENMADDTTHSSSQTHSEHRESTIEDKELTIETYKKQHPGNCVMSAEASNVVPKSPPILQVRFFTQLFICAWLGYQLYTLIFSF